MSILTCCCCGQFLEQNAKGRCVMNVYPKSISIIERIGNLSLPERSSLELCNYGSPELIKFVHKINRKVAQEIEVNVLEERIVVLYCDDSGCNAQPFAGSGHIEEAVDDIRKTVESARVCAI